MLVKGKEKLVELSDSIKKIIITTHFKPDGDALGSSLAMYHWLKDKGHDVSVIVPSDYPLFINWLPGNDNIIQYHQNTESSNRALHDADIIFCLDYSTLSRTECMAEVIGASPAQKWMIDHHLDPDDFSDLLYWDNKASATCQLIYNFITQIFGDGESITKDIATCLYTGIVTDTGSFRFRSVTSEVHQISADLIDKGAENGYIHEKLYNSNTESRLKFMGYCLSHCLIVIPEYNVAYFKIPTYVLHNYQIATGDTDGLVNYALSIQGIKLAALIVDRTELIKLSLRSVGDVPCNEICQKHFNGGGHLNASGGSSHSSLDETEAKLLAILPEYKDILTK